MEQNMLRTKELYDLTHTAAAPPAGAGGVPLAGPCPKSGTSSGPWAPPFPRRSTSGGERTCGSTRPLRSTPTTSSAGPCIIGPGTEVRPGAFIRGNALVGENCVVGNSTELKNVILFDNVQVPHYNYVGDSILGYKSHMGAGASPPT